MRARQVTHDSVLGAVRNQNGSRKRKIWIENPDKEILVKLTGTTCSVANLLIRSGIGFLGWNMKDDWALNKSSSMVKNESEKLKVLHDACWAKIKEIIKTNAKKRRK